MSKFSNGFSKIGYLIAVTGWVFGIFSFALSAKMQIRMERALAMIDEEKALRMTGPCGNKEEIITDARRGNGFLAGRFYTRTQRLEFYTKELGDGHFEVWLKPAGFYGPKLIMCRPRDAARIINDMFLQEHIKAKHPDIDIR